MIFRRWSVVPKGLDTTQFWDGGRYFWLRWSAARKARHMNIVALRTFKHSRNYVVTYRKRKP